VGLKVEVGQYVELTSPNLADGSSGTRWKTKRPTPSAHVHSQQPDIPAAAAAAAAAAVPWEQRTTFNADRRNLTLTLPNHRRLPYSAKKFSVGFSRSSTTAEEGSTARYIVNRVVQQQWRTQMFDGRQRGA